MICVEGGVNLFVCVCVYILYMYTCIVCVLVIDGKTKNWSVSTTLKLYINTNYMTTNKQQVCRFNINIRDEKYNLNLMVNFYYLTYNIFC